MKNAILITIDFINEIVNKESKVGSCADQVAEHNTIAEANKAIAWARKEGMLVAHVKVGFDDEYHTCPPNSPVFSAAKANEVFKLSGWGCEFHPDLAVEPTDAVIIKHRVNPIYATDLEALLRANEIKQVYLCGVSTNMAVQMCAFSLHDRDYQVTVLEKACAARTLENHQAALNNIQLIAKIQ